ncbi:hypothetical protein [Citrobacter sp. BDA59-3]|uniref:hypothetical protein n=1 Tax=Citrobacter sp. BDA59-3 TaxID=2781952 RepID=UPI00187F20E9|nr:hypothetical protein [Citrobacter sp. BDA59-3]QOV66787.1 hypothetical protein IP582_13945 [Citrobacter sp. BDA59-3]
MNQQMVTPDSTKSQTSVTITRQEQSSLLTSSMGLCSFLVNIDAIDVALLRQNQYVTTYLDNGPHILRVSNSCKSVGLGIRKSLKINAEGTPQKYETNEGYWGQYNIWRTG